MTATSRFLVVTPTRNEGPFILEWVAWYKMLGFDDILILSNDCTDHSPQMLDLLDQEGWISHQPHQPKVGKAPFISAFSAARKHPLIASADWMFLCDIDEFLVFHEGDRTIQHFVGSEPLDVAGIAFHWKVFGTSRLQTWEDGLVHRTFTRAAHKKSDANRFFKSLVYKPQRFKNFRSHRPVKFAGEWGAAPNVWINSAGDVLEDFDPNSGTLQMTKPELVTHSNAQLNHYITRTRENFAFKKGRLSASSLTDRYTGRFLNKFNRNERSDRSAHAYMNRFDVAYANILSLPGIRRLHHLCCADYIVSMCTERNDEPEKDDRYIHHMHLADQSN